MSADGSSGEQDLRVVLINVPPDDAGRIARELVERKLAACVNVMPNVTSYYAWEGKIEQDRESTLLVKTRLSLVPELTTAIRELHSYSVPEVIALVLERGAGNSAYLDWVIENTREPAAVVRSDGPAKKTDESV